ncbi:MAG: hypothetical protein GOVbin1753_103 [Prokaryotic dsDNA virus sp.]|nr:MAG: hypothetical protein GOVbin1753_103 [Prokaryotic dsDNA virus sp.]
MLLTIMNESGHTELVNQTSSQVIDQINDHPSHWVIIDGELTSREMISEVSWDTVTSVDLIPAIVGGTQ